MKTVETENAGLKRAYTLTIPASEIDAARVFAWLRWVDATFSTYRAGSEISRLGRGERLLVETGVRVVTLARTRPC